VIQAVGPSLPATPVELALSLANRLGRGIVHPFRRDGKGDWANLAGEAMVVTHVSQILGTRATSAHGVGELPWRPEFGSWLHLLKHAPITAATPALARLYCVEAIQRWEPRVRITDVSVVAEEIDTGNKLDIGARFNFIDLQRGTNIFEGLLASVVV
jgi:phage baseplate assembly protein W